MRIKHLFIAAQAKDYAVSTLCRLLRVARSWFYGCRASEPERQAGAQLKERRDRELLGLIHAELVAAGEVVSQRRIAKLMKDNGISPTRCEPTPPVTTLSNHKKSPSPNLLQQEFDCYTPNTVWVADITYCATDEGGSVQRGPQYGSGKATSRCRAHLSFGSRQSICK